jgi:hypothetical protein
VVFWGRSLAGDVSIAIAVAVWFLTSLLWIQARFNVPCLGLDFVAVVAWVVLVRSGNVLVAWFTCVPFVSLFTFVL